MRVLQWLPFAGAIAVARRSIPVALMLSVWFWGFFVLKGSSVDATVDSGAFFRFLLPAIPAFLLLAASLPLLIPKYGVELARRTALPRPRALGRRALVAAAVVLGLFPVVAAAASSPLRGPDEVLQHIEIAVPVADIELEATGQRVIRLRWSEPDTGSTRVFYKLFRSPADDRLPLLHRRRRRRPLHARLGRARHAPQDERRRPARPGHMDVQGGRGGELDRRSRAGRRLPALEPRHRHRSLTSRRWPREALGLAGLLAVAAFVYIRGVEAAANYDEGVYLASLDALRHGQELGTDVYASQPPGFYVLLQALSFLPGDGVEGIRVAFMLVALVGLGAAYAIGRQLAGVVGRIRRGRPARDHGALAGAGRARPGGHGLGSPRALRRRSRVLRTPLLVALGARSACSPGPRSPSSCSRSPVLAPLAVLLVARRSWRAAGAALAGALRSSGRCS